MNQVARKICATCGRQINWRKKWEKDWSTITYCSNTCRSNKIRPNSIDTSFESKILSTLAERRKLHGAAAVVTCEEVEAAVLTERQEFIESSEKYRGKERERERERESDRDRDTERDKATNQTQKASGPEVGLGPDSPANETSNLTPNNTRLIALQHGKGTSALSSNSNVDSSKEGGKDQTNIQTNIQTNSRTRERCRQAARRLAERGEIQITQRGKVTDPSFTKGVMELKLPE